MNKRLLLGWIAISVFAGLAWAMPTNIYTYDGVTTLPNMDSITESVAESGITTTYCCQRWDQKNAKLRIGFYESLSTEEKSTLDTIVSTNSDWSE